MTTVVLGDDFSERSHKTGRRYFDACSVRREATKRYHEKLRPCGRYYCLICKFSSEM